MKSDKWNNGLKFNSYLDNLHIKQIYIYKFKQ